jgi:interleukin-1 receptor-associated kinase 4
MSFIDNNIGFHINRSELSLNSELRHLSITQRNQLSNILDQNDCWKHLAAIIPKPDGNEGFLMTNTNINTLDDLKKRNRSPTQALLDFWGTNGRKRPTIELLITLLNDCHLNRAALYLCEDVLHLQSIHGLNHNSFNHISSDLNISINSCDEWNNLSTKLLEDCSTKQEKNNQNNGIMSASAPNESQINFSDSFYDNNKQLLLANEQIVNYSYNEIRYATNNFSDISVREGGHKLGEGAFGSVYRCQLSPETNTYFAVKKLKNDFQKQFLSELNVMNKFKHKNLLSICGLSTDGPSLCIVYEYMSKGSLQDCLAIDKQSLSWERRISIAIETAKGICYLHTFDAEPYVHRDIKSANILLDHNLNARVGDFGLVRIGSSGGSTATNPLATTIIGTSVYMAPEAFRGDISVKLDTFSFGVVLLELLTGLLPYDESREEPDLLLYFEDKFIDLGEDFSLVVNALIDRSAGLWDESTALQLFQLYRKCTEQRKKNRPTMIEVRIN